MIADLGVGNQGFTKLAKDRGGNELCIKCFNKEAMTAGGQAMEDLMHEFKALKMLECEAIARAVEMFQDESIFYLVQECYKGGDLTTIKDRAIQQGVSITE